MPAHPRSNRLVTALALAGVLLTTGPLASPLSASTPAVATRLNRAAFCDYLAKAIALLEAQRQTPLRDFLLAQLRRLEGSYCG